MIGWGEELPRAYPAEILEDAVGGFNLLQVAKVPVRPEMQEALTMAAVDATPGEAPLPQEIQ